MWLILMNLYTLYRFQNLSLVLYILLSLFREARIVLRPRARILNQIFQRARETIFWKLAHALSTASYPRRLHRCS